MSIVIKAIGIIFVCLAVVVVLKPDIIKSVMEFFKKGSRIYLAGLLRLALAILFLLAARECKNFWVILILGILFLISGLLVFVLGPARIRPIIDWFQKQSLVLLRMVALIPLVFGVIIIFFA